MSRCFIAIPVPWDISEILLNSAHRLQPDLNLVPAANHHITLAFLGNQSEEKIEKIGLVLSAISFPAIEIIIDRIAPFPKPTAKILAGWVNGCENLRLVRERVISSLNEVDVAFSENREYLPHITLARNHAVKQAKSPAIDLRFTANCMNLYLSESVNGRRTYSIIHSFSAPIT